MRLKNQVTFTRNTTENKYTGRKRKDEKEKVRVTRAERPPKLMARTAIALSFLNANTVRDDTMGWMDLEWN